MKLRWSRGPLVSRQEEAMDEVTQCSPLLMVGLIGLVAFLIVAAMLLWTLLWQLGRVVM